MKIDKTKFLGKSKPNVRDSHDVYVSVVKGNNKRKTKIISVLFNIDVSDIFKDGKTFYLLENNRMYFLPTSDPHGYTVSFASKSIFKKRFQIYVKEKEVKKYVNSNIVGYCDMKFDVEEGLWYIEAEKNKM